MEEYTGITRQLTIQHPEDDITAEEFKYDQNSHPRSVMTLRRSNGVPYPYLVNTVVKIITIGDGCDPYTRRPLSQLVRDRAILFSRCLKEFPNYKLTPEKISDLYNRWISCDREDRLLELEAQCFLQAEDLISIFQSFSGKGSLNNRQEAEKFLADSGKTWVLRHSSLKDTEYDKAYALTQRVEGSGQAGSDTGSYVHTGIVHRVGEGFLSGVRIYRGESVDSLRHYNASFPTIVHLLTTLVPEIHRPR
jgi:hypothetical protein